MVENEGVFKTAVVGGFDRNSVLDYIKQIDKKVKNNEDKLIKKIEDLHSKNKELTENNQELTQTIQMLQKEIKEKDNENNKIKEVANVQTENINALRQDVQRLNDLLNKTQMDLNEQIKKHRDLITKYDCEIEKSKKYEQLGYFKAVLRLQGILEPDTIVSSPGEKQNDLVKVVIEGDLP